MDFIELTNGMSIPCKGLTDHEYNLYFESSNKIYIPHFFDTFGVFVYEINSTCFVLRNEDYYTLYYSFEDIEMVLSEDCTTTQILLNKNPFHSEFIDNINFLITQMVETLNIENSINGEGLCLQIIQKIDILNNAGDFKKKHFLNLIALIGNEIIHIYDVSWNMILSEDGVTWNPYIKVNTNGKNIPIFVYLYEDIFEIDDPEDMLEETYEHICYVVKMRL